MSSGWDKYREAINNKWLLETPYNALKCFTDAKLERYELSINSKLSLKERRTYGFEIKLLSPLKMDRRKDFLPHVLSWFLEPSGGYSSFVLCFRDKYTGDSPNNFHPRYDYYFYDFYNFKEYNNFFDFSFNKFLDILGHDLIPHVYYGLIFPEIENGARIIDRRYFIQEYELLRRMVFISRELERYVLDESATYRSSSYLYEIYFNNATETTVKNYEEEEKEFNSAVERFKNKEEVFRESNPRGVSYLTRACSVHFNPYRKEYSGYYNLDINFPRCRVSVIPIKKVKCIIVNKYGGFNRFSDISITEYAYQYTNSGSFILNDGTLLNKENSIFISFDDFIDSNDTQEDIDNKVIRRNDLYDLFSPILKEPSKSEFEDCKYYLDYIINNTEDIDYNTFTIKNELILSNYYQYYDDNKQEVLLDSYVIACYDYLAGGELEFDDDGLYSSGDSSSNNKEKDTTDNIETNNNTES